MLRRKTIETLSLIIIDLNCHSELKRAGVSRVSPMSELSIFAVIPVPKVDGRTIKTPDFLSLVRLTNHQNLSDL